MIKGKRIKLQYQLLFERVRKYGLILFFIFFFTFLHPFSSDGISKEERVIQEDKTGYFSNNLFNSSHLPLHFPFKSAPSPSQPEDPDENELKDNLDDDWNLWIWKQSFKNYLNVCSPSGSLFFKISQSLKGRSTVSLFILYHSWKSNLI
ncbi:MAG: hypothetical protein ACKVQB_12580 [Bacteroidia bacterium]